MGIHNIFKGHRVPADDTPYIWSDVRHQNQSPIRSQPPPVQETPPDWVKTKLLCFYISFYGLCIFALTH